MLVRYELTEAKSITRLPKDFHSVKGCGKTEPKAEDAIVADDGVEIPLGRPTDSSVKKNTTLLYNEYIVYKEAQVHIRYLLKVQFQYKWSLNLSERCLFMLNDEVFLLSLVVYRFQLFKCLSVYVVMKSFHGLLVAFECCNR